MSTWKDRWTRRPVELAGKVGRAASEAIGPRMRPSRPGDRPRRIDEQGRRLMTWPDDDLEDLEHPRASGWLDPRRVRNWLRR